MIMVRLRQENYQESKKNNNWAKIKDKEYIVDFGDGKRETIKGSDLINLNFNRKSFVKKIATNYFESVSQCIHIFSMQYISRQEIPFSQ